MLISIGVLAVGLLSVAALIPAGRHEIAQGARLDYAAMIGRAAFRDLQIRAFLNPGNAAGTTSWQTVGSPPNDKVWQPAGPTGDAGQPFVINGVKSLQVAFAIDPLGLFAIQAAGGTDTKFPYNSTGLYLTRVAPFDVTASGAREFMDTVFRSSVDLTTSENSANRDLPPQQFWFKDTAAIPNPLRRASAGNYSWLATIVSDPTTSALNSKVTVSVAVFHKRDLSASDLGESVVNVSMNPSAGGGIGGGEATLLNLSKPVRPGQWIMLAGRRTGPPILDYFRWYRVVAAGALTGPSQQVTLSGTDWPGSLAATTQAFIFDNIVAVYEKNLSLEFKN
ncbi:MAG: hypothetical protein WDZ48_05080 [Pirellulales bacterium]